MHDADDGLIAIRMDSRIDQSQLRAIASEVAQLAREHNCYLILNDAREATLGLSTTEIYELPKMVLEILSESGIQIHKFKRAVVMANDVDDFVFFETVSQNRGQNVRLFRDMGEARSWLLSK